MWVATPIGFFSVVQTREGDRLTVRARVKSDLDALREVYCPSLSETETYSDTDYAHRGFCTRQAWASALMGMALDIDYGNFKDKVEKTQGVERHDVYAKVWRALLELEDLERATPRKPQYFQDVYDKLDDDLELMHLAALQFAGQQKKARKRGKKGKK